jgi:pyruvate dehydrogenase E2 component (dihydrolipoamide acetyltransferase)
LEVPAPFAGVVKEVKVKEGDKVSQEAVLLADETSAADGVETPPRSELPLPRADAATVRCSASGRTPTAACRFLGKHWG